MEDLRKHILFTHAGCLDGSAAAILFLQAGGRKENVKLVPAGQLEEYYSLSGRSKSTAPLLFVDVAPSSEDFAQELAHKANVTVIDHHASAAKFAKMNNFYIDVENKACGSKNFLNWMLKNLNVCNGKFNHPAYTRFTDIIDDHDRWQQKIPFSMEQPKFFSFVGQQEFIKRFMNVEERFAEEKESYWTPFEAELMVLVAKEQERRFRALLPKFKVLTREHNGKQFRTGYIVSGEVNCSELLNMYLNENPDVDVACQVNLDQNKLSLRSNDRVNMTEYSGRYGGGGHKNAAGHPLPDNIVETIAELIHGKNV